MQPGEIVRKAREKRGWSQADLARRIHISQVAINKIESGETKHSKFLPRIAVELGLDLSMLDPRLSSSGSNEIIPKEQIVTPNRDFPIYASAEGGHGEVIRSSDAVDWVPRPSPVAHVKQAYGIIVSGESMVPEYRPGDMAIVNPMLPIIGGEVYIFYREMHGEARATIKHLRRAGAELWHVSQWNPPPGGKHDFSLSRREWTICHRVVGKFTR